MRSVKSTLSLYLSDAGYSLTVPRQMVFDTLESYGPLTMNELTQRLKGKADRSSIYRTTSLFEKLGIIQRVQQSWKYKIELTDTFLPHHHHLTCLNCRQTISFDEPENLEDLLRGVTGRYGFLPKNHTLEIEGLCSTCKANAGSQQPA